LKSDDARSSTQSDIGAAGCIGTERSIPDGLVAAAGGVSKECGNTIGRVVVVVVVNERLRTADRVAFLIAKIMAVLAPPGGVGEKRERSVGRC
jgi:hypothetical protein